MDRQREGLRAQPTATGFAPDDVERLVTVGLDWDGKVTGAFGFTSANEQPLVAFVDPTTLVATEIRAPEPIAAVVELLAAQPERT
jgi:hypothetical protein